MIGWFRIGYDLCVSLFYIFFIRNRFRWRNGLDSPRTSQHLPYHCYLSRSADGSLYTSGLHLMFFGVSNTHLGLTLLRKGPVICLGDGKPASDSPEPEKEYDGSISTTCADGSSLKIYSFPPKGSENISPILETDGVISKF